MFSLDRIILYVIILFLILGAIDRLRGNKIGLGAEFENGILLMGQITLSISGIIILAPIIGAIITPIISPVFSFLKSDPSIFATIILPLDQGGTNLAFEISKDKNIAIFSSFILGSMFGPTVTFTIPIAVSIITEEDHKYVSLGLAIGIITIPIGALLGGLAANYNINVIVLNLIPVVFISIILSLALVFMKNIIIKIFNIFSYFLFLLSLFGFVIAIIEYLLGFTILEFTFNDKLIKAIPLSEAMPLIYSISFILAGSFPLVFTIRKLFSKHLLYFAKKISMNEYSAIGFISTLANNIPTFQLMKDMDYRGKIINSAFAVSAAFVFGDHIAFTTIYSNGEYRYMIVPMIIAKLTAGLSSIILAYFLSNKIVD